jgi:hypothetical protein
MLKSDANRRQELVEYLAQVHALSQAIASAISAIEKNDLRKLEAHLAVQESICNRLAGAKEMLFPTAKGKVVAGENPDAQLLQEIRQAHLALAQLNRVYAALLKRARRSAGLIIALYRSHGEGYDREVSTLSQRHTWSCEV